MRDSRTRQFVKYATAATFLLALTGRVIAGDDNPGSGLLGRLCRSGGSSSSGGSTAQPGMQQSASLPYGGSFGNSLPPGGSTGGPATPLFFALAGRPGRRPWPATPRRRSG